MPCFASVYLPYAQPAQPVGKHYSQVSHVHNDICLRFELAFIWHFVCCNSVPLKWCFLRKFIAWHSVYGGLHISASVFNLFFFLSLLWMLLFCASACEDVDSIWKGYYTLAWSIEWCYRVCIVRSRCSISGPKHVCKDCNVVLLDETQERRIFKQIHSDFPSLNPLLFCFSCPLGWLTTERPTAWPPRAWPSCSGPRCSGLRRKRATLPSTWSTRTR